jgi:hypothetical protein
VIAFGPAALAEAFDRVGRSALTRSASAVTAVEMLPDTQTVRFQLGHGAEACTATASGSRLAALLIGFCMTLRFPLPANAAKAVDVGDEFVSLWLTVSMASLPADRRRQAK